jgi:hypothetical protein
MKGGSKLLVDRIVISSEREDSDGSVWDTLSLMRQPNSVGTYMDEVTVAQTIETDQSYHYVGGV